MEHLRMHLHVSVTGESPSTVRYPACKSVPWCVCLVRVITSSRPLWNKRIYAQRAHDCGPGGVVTQVRAASPVTAARLLLCCRRDRRRKHTYSRIPMGCEGGQGPRLQMRYLHVGSQTDMSRPPSHLDQTLVGKDQFFGVRDPGSHRCSSPCWSCWAAANGVDWGRSHIDKGVSSP